MVFAAWQGDFGKNEWVDWCSHQGLLFYLSVYSHPCQRARLKTDPSPSRVQIGSSLWFTPLGFFPVLPWRPAAESRAGWTKSWMDNQAEGRDFGVEADKHNRIRFGQSNASIIGNNKQFSGSKWRWYKSKKETGIGPRFYNRRKTEMSGEGRRMEEWRRKRLLSDTEVVSKGRCPGATAATLLRDGAGWRVSRPTWANKYSQRQERRERREEQWHLFNF